MPSRPLIPASSLIFKRNDPNTPLTVTGVVRLADKYLIEPLHRRLVQQVCDDWPATLNDYDIRQGEVEALRQVAKSNTPFEYTPDGGGGRISDVIPEPVSDILFAREFGCPQILPAAFYQLSLIPVAYDWSKQFDHKPLARWTMLDGENLLRCMQGCQVTRQYRPCISEFLSDGCEDVREPDPAQPRATDSSVVSSRSFSRKDRWRPMLTHSVCSRSVVDMRRCWSFRRSDSPISFAPTVGGYWASA